ncbi:MAG: small ribosomal subunit Rsm22 family protein [Parvibaculaceae bacterium]
MELPPLLRHGIDEALDGLPLADLARAAALLSERYRSETLDGRLHLSDDLAARAYLATRLPATYAAIRDAMAKLAALRPDFQPATLLDVGAGPGTALWAAADCWPGLADAVLIEKSSAIRGWGEKLSGSASLGRVRWHDGDLTTDLVSAPPLDLVCLAYVLSELPGERRAGLIDGLWSLTSDMLLIVEPGTPKGWERILAARGRLIGHGAHIVAPCPHREACPVAAPDWCHFSRRVARSRLHRLAKAADVPWEDEKYIYIAAARRAGLAAEARILAPPRAGKGRIDLKLCCADGGLRQRTISKRDGALFKAARRRDWGDVIEEAAGDRPSHG